MKNRIKKAFTLVELLVVIAILGILASVSILGYTSLTDKTYISNATTELSQIKTIFMVNDSINDNYKIKNGTLTYTYDTFDELVESLEELGNYQDRLEYNNGIIKYNYSDEYYANWNLSTNLINGFKNS